MLLVVLGIYAAVAILYATLWKQRSLRAVCLPSAQYFLIAAVFTLVIHVQAAVEGMRLPRILLLSDAPVEALRSEALVFLGLSLLFLAVHCIVPIWERVRKQRRKEKGAMENRKSIIKEM